MMRTNKWRSVPLWKTISLTQSVCWCARVVELPGAASGVFVNLSSLLRSSSTKERGDQEQDQGDREDGEGLLSAQVIKAHSNFRISSEVFQT